MSKNKILLSIIVPLYNEENTILKVLKKLSKLKETYNNIQIIVINDGSKDNSQIILDNNSWFYDELIINSTNEGKGNAVKKGLALAKGQYITFQDADLEYDPIEFIKFIKLINNFSPDLIIGSRLNFADYSRSHNIFNKYGNQLITFMFNILSSK